MPRLEMGNCAFGLEFVIARKAGYIFGFFIIYIIEHSVARHDALCSNHGNTLTAVTMLYAVEASTLSPVRVLNPAEASTLSPVMMLYPTEA